MRAHRKQTVQALRSAERRQREDESPRLRDEVPELISLSLDIEERSEGTAALQQKHTRRIVVDHAPALFLIPCGDPKCEDGGHDVTYAIMRSLRSGEAEFTGEDSCNGSLGPSTCRRVLYYQAIAEYRR